MKKEDVCEGYLPLFGILVLFAVFFFFICQGCTPAELTAVEEIDQAIMEYQERNVERSRNIHNANIQNIQRSCNHAR